MSALGLSREAERVLIDTGAIMSATTWGAYQVPSVLTRTVHTTIQPPKIQTTLSR